jgi:hypothetical protein
MNGSVVLIRELTDAHIYPNPTKLNTIALERRCSFSLGYKMFAIKFEHFINWFVLFYGKNRHEHKLCH